MEIAGADVTGLFYYDGVTVEPAAGAAGRSGWPGRPSVIRSRAPWFYCGSTVVLQSQDAHVRDLHQVDGRRGVADLGVPAGRIRRCDAVGQDDEVPANRHVARVGADVRAVKEELD